MKDQAKTKQALIRELVTLRQKLAELEPADADCNPGESSQQQYVEGPGGNFFASSIPEKSEGG
jgi:hypothetical protein